MSCFGGVRHTMKNSTAISVVMMIGMFIACSDNFEPLGGDCVRLSVEVPCADTEIQTRTSITGSKASFTNGDVVGVFETLTAKNNVAFSYDGSLWSTLTPLYWYNGTSIHTFYAYYPYNSSSQGMTVALPVLSQQKVATVPDAACDMLVTSSALAQARSSGTTVTLAMKHAFALLRFDIKMSILGLLNPYRLDSLIIRGGNSTGTAGNPYGMFNTVNTVSKVNYNLSSLVVSLSPNDNTTCAQFLRTTPVSVNLATTAVSVYVLILPGTYTKPAPALKMNLSTLGLLPKNTGYLTLPGGSSFTAGNMYVYQVSIGLNTKTAINEEGRETFLPAEIRLLSP